jgi:hypothetical protein
LWVSNPLDRRNKEIPMYRKLAVLAALAVAASGLVLGAAGTAGASVVLAGTTSCTNTPGPKVQFAHPLTANPPTGTENVSETAAFTCTTSSVTPPVTSLSGTLKLVLEFKKSGVDRARRCSRFEGTTPVDYVFAGKGEVSWQAYSGSTNLGAVPSVITYSGTYSADVGGDLAIDLTTTTPTVTGSFAGSATAPITFVLPSAYPAAICPMNTLTPIVATSATLSI